MESLDRVRDAALRKCEGISEEDARRAPLPGSPLMTISALISHLRWVEYFWIQVVFLGGADRAPWTEEDPDREMRIATSIPLETLREDYEQQSAHHDALLAGVALDTTSATAGDDGERVTLRWVLLHLVEETAQHNGHLDILREMADGRTGL